MENPIPKLSQTSIISKKPGFLFDKLKTLTSSNCHRVLYFSLKFCTRFLLSNVYKRVCGIFFILFRSLNKSIFYQLRQSEVTKKKTITITDTKQYETNEINKKQSKMNYGTHRSKI